MTNKASGQSGFSAAETAKWVVVAALVAVAVWGNSYYGDYSPLYRALGVLAIGVVAAFVALQTEQGRSFNQLRKDAMVEMRKITWPTRRETLQTTLIVLAFVVLIALVLMVLDWILNGVISAIIG